MMRLDVSDELWVVLMNRLLRFVESGEGSLLSELESSLLCFRY